MKQHSLWIEKYRSETLEEYIGNDAVKNRISDCISKNDIPHFIFTGTAGTGKTTLAKLIVKNIKCDYLYINASDENGIDIIRDKVKQFASTSTFQLEQHISDTDSILPRNTQITTITGTTTLTLTIQWDGDTYIGSATNVSFVANDLSNDNYALYDGARIVFSADTNENVRNKIYVVRFSDIQGTGTQVITLTEAENGLMVVPYLKSR